MTDQFKEIVKMRDRMASSIEVNGGRLGKTYQNKEMIQMKDIYSTVYGFLYTLCTFSFARTNTITALKQTITR